MSTLLLFLFFVSRQTWKHISLSCTCLELNTLLAFFHQHIAVSETLRFVFCSRSFLVVGFFFLSFYVSGSAEEGETASIFVFLCPSHLLRKGSFFFLYQRCSKAVRRIWGDGALSSRRNTCKDFILSVVMELKIQMKMYIYVHMPTLFYLLFFCFVLLRPVCSLLQLLLAML